MTLDAWVPAAEKALALAQRGGLDAEVRAEVASKRTLVTVDGALALATSFEGAGLGVRVVRGDRSGYAATNEPTAAEVRRVVAEAARMAGARARVGKGAVPPLAAPAGEDLEVEPALALLRRAARAGRDAGKEVASVVAGYQELRGERLVLTTRGARARWAPRAATLDVSVTSKSPSGLARGRAFHGGSVGLDDFEGERGPEALAERAARWAAERIDARRPPAGRHRALLDPHLAGTLAHESFGHLAEGDLVAAGWSPLRGRKGQRLASRAVSIVDTGLPPEGAGGVALPFDDEGTPSRAVHLVRKGVLEGFLESRATAGEASTGNARALDWRYPPICRMRNTYLEPGELTLEEALEALRDGIYACGSTGGEARSDGNFTFTTVRLYRVERGEVTEPLREAAILGNVLTLLRDVQGLTRELRLTAGANVYCGKWEQWPLPVAYGGPHVLVRDAVFGGEGTAWRGA